MTKKTISAILILATLFLSGGCARQQRTAETSRDRDAAQPRRTSAPTTVTIETTEEIQWTMPETMPPETTPPTLNEKLTNPFLRQALEEYFIKDFTEITQEDVDTIQFLYIKSESIVMSAKAIPESVLFLPWEDEDDLFSMMTDDVDYTELTMIVDKQFDDSYEIFFDSRINDASGIVYFEGLKTLALGHSSIYLKDLESMPQLENLVIYSMYETEDFAAFAKFPNLTQLTVSGADLVRLDGLSELTGLQHLGLYRTGISNLDKLSEMKNIASLTLFDNEELSSIQMLADMTWLKELYIEDVPYSDINVIADLTQLERLTISDTGVKSVNFISDLTQLLYLRVDRNRELKTLPSLTNCIKLEEIYLDCDNFEDLSGLSGLSSIVKATLLSPDSLSFLPEYSALKHLELQLGWLLEDISPLAALTELEFLKMSGNTYSQVEGFASLANLNGLRELDLSSFDNHIRFDFVYDLVGLERLNLSGNNVFSDFSRIGNLVNLQVLYLDHIGIYSDFTVQQNGGFIDIYYHGEQTFDQAASALAALTNLKLLSIAKNEMSDLSFAAGMSQLSVLNAADNYITDVSPLSQMSQLMFLNLEANVVENKQELDSLTNTYIII